ncbi:MAG: hypothetical protein HOC71_07315 [Candidatus Latescibacteria bacterium]|jgi:hypothetical protein|nr:hypothetical protein [Candidatus Latescibacterota bacterium]
MKRIVYIGLLCFCLGITSTLLTQHIFASPVTKGAFIRPADMEWVGQESHDPGTALKWIL